MNRGCLGKFHKLAKQYEQANMKSEGNDMPEYSWCCECGHKVVIKMKTRDYNASFRNLHSFSTSSKWREWNRELWNMELLLAILATLAITAVVCVVVTRLWRNSG